MLLGEGAVGVADRDVPAFRCVRQAQHVAEAIQRVEHMATRGRRDAFVDEQAMAFLGLRPFVADATACPDRRAQQVGARRELAQQQGVETASVQSGAQFAPDRSQTLLLVDGDELDARQIPDHIIGNIAGIGTARVTGALLDDGVSVDDIDRVFQIVFKALDQLTVVAVCVQIGGDQLFVHVDALHEVERAFCGQVIG